MDENILQNRDGTRNSSSLDPRGPGPFLLQNKAKLWISEEEWNFKTKGDLIYVENVSNQKVLEATSNDKVTLEDIEDGKTEQLWKKGEPNTEGYFILENCKVPKILTAISSSVLQMKGNIILS